MTSPLQDFLVKYCWTATSEPPFDVPGGHSQSRLATPQNAKSAQKAHLEQNGMQYDPPQTTKAPSCAALDVCGLWGPRVAFFV